MKRSIVIILLGAVLAVLIFYNYLENKEDTVVPATNIRTDVTKELSMYEDAEKALAKWEEGRKRSGLEQKYEEILKKSIGKLRAENPYVVNMQEAVNTAELPIPKEIMVEKDRKLLRNADSFIFNGKKYDVGYYRKDRDKTVKVFLEAEGGKKASEIKMEDLKPVPLYGFKTIKFTKNGPQILVAMMFAGDDSWSTRNFYLQDKNGKINKIFSWEGAWVEERYCDVDGDKVPELMLLRRLNWEPEGAAEIVKSLKEKKLNGYNAIFYEHEIIKWDEKNGKLEKIGSVIKTDFSHK